MAIKRGSKITAEFSMASMTDIVFLLLIFFLLTSTLINTNALQLLLPKSNSQAGVKQKVSISIKDKGNEQFEYYVNTKKVLFNEIERALRLELTTPEPNAPEPVISLYLDRSVPADQIVKMMNIAYKNHYRMILATAPE